MFFLFNFTFSFVKRYKPDKCNITIIPLQFHDNGTNLTNIFSSSQSSNVSVILLLRKVLTPYNFA